ncbi:MAG: hypothetical protein J6W30_00170 [Bacteroidales bacterium]|nr:hypothetical protein [Bacteroidales bacterium]
MKKLAMALLCLVSVAFFASCSKEGQPSISVLNEDGYVQDGAIVTLDEDINFGFVMTSSPDSEKELTKLVVKIDGVQWAEINLTGMKEYTYRETISYGDSKELIGESVITATVTDKAGEEATASITLYFEEVEVILIPEDFTWNRHGGNAATGNLAELGLQWTSNEKEIYAVIKPLQGAALYKFGAGRDIWSSTNTEAEKIALFQENLEPITEFKEISCTAADKDYDIVLGTVYNNQVNLIHITHSAAYTFKGTDVTITGQYK